MKSVFVILILSIFFISCHDESEAQSKALVWKKDSKHKLDTFKLVLKEFEANKELFDSLKYNGKDIFVQKKYIEKLEDYGAYLPFHTKWFGTSEVNYINYQGNGEIEVKYDSDNSSGSYYPLYYEPHLFYSKAGLSTWFPKSLATIYDSTSLGDDWYFVVTRCDGCGG